MVAMRVRRWLVAVSARSVSRTKFLLVLKGPGVEVRDRDCQDGRYRSQDRGGVALVGRRSGA